MKKFNDQILSKGIVSGHFIFHSGRHALEKFEFDNISSNRRLKRKTAKAIAKIVSEEHIEVDAIAAIGDGANCLAKPVSKRVSKLLGKEVVGYETASNIHGEFRLVGGNVHARDKNWVIIDDVFTKGTTGGKVSGLLSHWGGNVLGLVTLLNRNIEGLNEIPDPGEGDVLPVHSVIYQPMEDFAPESCPMLPNCPQSRGVIF